MNAREGGLGGRLDPLRTVAAAVDALELANEHRIVMLAPGQYTLGVTNLPEGPPFTLIGHCPADTELQVSGVFIGPPGVFLEGLTVSGLKNAPFDVSGGFPMGGDNLVVVGGDTGAVQLNGGAMLILTRTRIDAPADTNSATVAVQDSSFVCSGGCRISGGAGAGVLVNGFVAPATANLTNAVVRDVRDYPGGGGGVGVKIFGQTAIARLTDVRVVGATGIGVRAQMGGVLEATRVVVADTGDGLDEPAILLEQAGASDLQEVDIVARGPIGLRVTATELTSEEVRVRGGTVSLEGGASVSAVGLSVASDEGPSLRVVDRGTELVANTVMIHDGGPAGTAAVVVAREAAVELERASLVSDLGDALEVGGGSAILRSAVLGGAEEVAELNEGLLDLYGARLVGGTAAGVEADSGTLRMELTEVVGARPAVTVGPGANATLDDVALLESEAFGMQTFGETALRGLLVRDTRPLPGVAGWGLLIGGGASVTGSRLALTRNATVGLRVDGGGSAELTRVEVVDSVLGEGRRDGVVNRGSLALTEFLVRGHRVGVAAIEEVSLAEGSLFDAVVGILYGAPLPPDAGPVHRRGNERDAAPCGDADCLEVETPAAPASE